MGNLEKGAFLCIDDTETLPIERYNFLKKNFDYIFLVYDKDSDWYMDLPNPGLAYQKAIEYKLDLSQSIVIGKNSGITIKTLVGELDGKDGLRFVGNIPGYSAVAGELIPDGAELYIQENEIGMKYLVLRNDYSDKDLKFAINSGMGYMDMDRFLENSFIDHADLMFYASTKSTK